MYKVAVIMASGEMIAYSYSNPKKYVNYFRQKDIYNFMIFSQENLDECFAFMRLGKFDSLIICSNAVNDLDVKKELESHKAEISAFIESGNGVLILLQYGLLTRNQILNIIEPSIFNSTNDGKNLYCVSPIELSKQIGGTLEFKHNSILLQYPNFINKNLFIHKALNNSFRETIAPGFIKDYPRAYFLSPINYTINNETESICIYSGSDMKRVIITTMPVDLQEQLPLLENMISYVSRGRPAINLLKCENSSKCIFTKSSNNCGCELELLLKKVNLHYTSRDIIDPNTDYEKIEERSKYNLVCDEAVLKDNLSIEKRVLPIRTSLSYLIPSDKTNTTVLIEEKSIIAKWVDLGLVWIESKLDDKAEKWDTLYTTKEVALLYSDAGKTPNNYIKKKISSYLQKHNINGDDESFSFDGVDNATEAARIINDSFDLKFNFLKNKEKEQNSKIKAVNTINYEEVSLYECAMEILYNNTLKSSDIISIFERFVTSRCLNNASWENDVLTTSIVLRALLRIEKMPQAKNYIGKFNLICSCFEDESEEKLTIALLKSIEASRDYGYEQFRIVQQKENDIKILLDENNVLRDKLEEQKTIEDRTRFHITICSALIIFSIGLIWLFIGFIIYLPKNLNQESYWQVVRDYIFGQGLFQSILSFGALLVVAVSFVGIKTTNNNKRNVFYRLVKCIKNTINKKRVTKKCLPTQKK